MKRNKLRKHILRSIEFTWLSISAIQSTTHLLITKTKIGFCKNHDYCDIYWLPTLPLSAGGAWAYENHTYEIQTGVLNSDGRIDSMRYLKTGLVRRKNRRSSEIPTTVGNSDACILDVQICILDVQICILDVQICIIELHFSSLLKPQPALLSVCGIQIWIPCV